MVLPLCVDLDGTLIKTDVLQEMILIYIYRWPHKIFNLILWLCRGRAYLKQQLSQSIDITDYKLPYHQEFLSWLRHQKSTGRHLVLVTASDQRPAKIIANDIGIFNDVMASDGKRNLRADCKAQALIDKFGDQNFSYAGNSKDDLKVWVHAGEIIAVNTPAQILAKAYQINKPLVLFKQSPQPSLMKLYFTHNIYYWIVFLTLPWICTGFWAMSLISQIFYSVVSMIIIISSYHLLNLVTMRSTQFIHYLRPSALTLLLQNGEIEISSVFKICILTITLCIITILLI